MKFDLSDKIKRKFFQFVAESVLLYGFTIWTLMKRLEKKLDADYIKMMRAVSNKFWNQHPTKKKKNNSSGTATCFLSHTHPNKKNMTCWKLLEKQRRNHERYSPVDSYIWIHQY